MSAHADLKDFAERTRKNLTVIEALAKTHLGQKHSEGVFEVTQLVNSLLGLLVFPQQEFFDKLPETKLADMGEPVWKNLNVGIWDRYKWVGRGSKRTKTGVMLDKTFKNLAICLRNGIAHCNVELEADVKGDICTIRIWNTPDENNPSDKDFEIAMDVETMRAIAVSFIDQLKK